MSECITSSDKKEFIQWFLNQHQLQKREAAWLLSYLASEDDILIESILSIISADYPKPCRLQPIPFRWYRFSLPKTST